ncbi:M14 family metallocarboxypeptidase [Thalassotalea sp. G2M2-11]|uniref:M14 family metallopeptidase n=1 Tax=Thalassotalea sp. G2M2-11 TaxID=2787627 RepID=UPI0019D30C34|nr:M14 family metallocarboxypeptidase [Thalassotalea sp. G2M2-11]
MTEQQAYPIGEPGKKWGAEEKKQWFAKQTVKRSYEQEVLSQLSQIHSALELTQIGGLSLDKARYPVFAVVNKTFDANKKTVLITGGVHGYETSGVHGALLFLKTRISDYLSQFNFIICPCVSPWGYETINRWNPNAVDPNRSFYADSPSEEAANVMNFIASLAVDVDIHFDLHETTDSDNSEFRPALAARDACVHDNWNIPDGFYLVADSTKPQVEFQHAIIESVEKVTHIAPADENEQLIGVPLSQFGVINYAARDLGLCMGLTDAKYVTTTEVYPDSPKVNNQTCNLAQVAVITGGLDYILNNDA